VAAGKFGRRKPCDALNDSVLTDNENMPSGDVTVKPSTNSSKSPKSASRWTLTP
jgi:hypothetical protein